MLKQNRNLLRTCPALHAQQRFLFSGPNMQAEAEAKAAVENFKARIEEVSHIDELKSYDEWEPKVFKSQQPVILDCYADWCQPCKKLTPILEQLTNDANGKFKLVKLNIDTLPQLAKGLNVKSIPALFLIYKGNVMDTVVGMDIKKV